MATRKTGISPDLIIHPGETISDILIERNISQLDLATSAGVSTAYVSNVIAGKKAISAKFAMALEYALGVPWSFWINLQANYDAEIVAANEENTITADERTAFSKLGEVIDYLQSEGTLTIESSENASILNLRHALRISNINSLKEFIPAATLKMSNSTQTDPYILGAWIRLCQLSGESQHVGVPFSEDNVDSLVTELKASMFETGTISIKKLKGLFARYGIDFSIAKYFKGAPVQGYVAPKNDGSYQLVVTNENTNSGTFWLSLLHELGHIVNGDIGRSSRFLDNGCNYDKEAAADAFARRMLISEKDYLVFLSESKINLESIKKFALSQNVLPYLVVCQLLKDNKIVPGEFDALATNTVFED